MHNYTLLEASTVHKNDTDLALKDTQLHLKDTDQRAIVQQRTEVGSSTTNPLYESDIVYNSLLIIPLVGWCALITSVLIAFFRSEKFIQSSILQQIKQSRSALKPEQLIPCSRCRYFSTNAYVRCAVHPSKALTGQAVDCSDYHSKQKI